MNAIKYTASSAAKAVEAFNRRFPVGTFVRFYPLLSNRDTYHGGKIRNPAWVLESGNVPVTMIEGKAGCVACDHIEAIA